MTPCARCGGDVSVHEASGGGCPDRQGSFTWAFSPADIQRFARNVHAAAIRVGLPDLAASAAALIKPAEAAPEDPSRFPTPEYPCAHGTLVQITSASGVTYDLFDDGYRIYGRLVAGPHPHDCEEVRGWSCFFEYKRSADDWGAHDVARTLMALAGSRSDSTLSG